MNPQNNTAIIIPCYNEENRIDHQAFINFIQTHENHLLCFVNDGSTDDTISVLENIKSAQSNRVHIVDMPKNGGKSAAVRAGAIYLADNTDAEFIGFIDADLSTDFEDFNALVQTLQSNSKLDLVYGSRNKGENAGIDRNFLRAVFSRIVKAFIYLILRLPIEDTQCGAKVFRRSVIKTAFAMPFQTKWLFDVEIFIRLKRYSSPESIMDHMYEQPLNRWVHADDSKLGLNDALQIPMKLIVIWYSYNIVRTAA